MLSTMPRQAHRACREELVSYSSPFKSSDSKRSGVFYPSCERAAARTVCVTHYVTQRRCVLDESSRRLTKDNESRYSASKYWRAGDARTIRRACPCASATPVSIKYLSESG